MSEPAATLTIQLTIGDAITAVDLNLSEAELNLHVDDVIGRMVRPALKRIMPSEKKRLHKLIKDAEEIMGVPFDV